MRLTMRNTQTLLLQSRRRRPRRQATRSTCSSSSSSSSSSSTRTLPPRAVSSPPALLLSTVLVLLSLSTCSCFLPRTSFLVSSPTKAAAAALQQQQQQQHHVRYNVFSLGATRSPPGQISSINNTDTWSRRTNSQDEGSRFGVRRRVRRVLEKAKIRTGRNNYSAEVVAEAASIGALNEQADLVFSDDFFLSSSSSSTNQNEEDTNGFTPTPPPPTSSTPNNTTGLVLEKTNSQQEQPKQDSSSTVDVDALLTAENMVDPLPFRLPKLSNEQKKLLAAGERIQEQSKMGREGSGYIVLDVKAPPYVVWECLLDFEAYPQYISTVRSMRMFTNTHLASSYLAEQPVLPGTGREMRHYGTASISRASFVLSKFKLKIAAMHKYQPHPDGHYMVFTLDRACKNVVLKDAKGIWYTESNPDGLGQDVTRVWLLCEVKVSSILPSMIVDYVAQRAMPRATNWLRPQVEEMRKALMDE